MKQPATIRAIKAEVARLALAWYDDPADARRGELADACAKLKKALRPAPHKTTKIDDGRVLVCACRECQIRTRGMSFRNICDLADKEHPPKSMTAYDALESLQPGGGEKFKQSLIDLLKRGPL